jgi:C4-dicarboxylate-specific signal transduction histidine kinase
MGVRIAVVIALATLFSYLHMLNTLREEALLRLERYVSERSQREQLLFLLAGDNHALLRKAMEERLRAWSQEDPNPRFDSLFAQMPDGTVRNRPEGFDGRRDVGAFIPKGVPLDDGFRRRVLAAYDVLSQYGPAFRARFTDTYITLAEGPIIVYWPERPNFSLEAEPDYPSLTYDYYVRSLPEHNPQRQTVWGSVFLEPVSQRWMTSAATPVEVDGRFIGSFGHDVFLDELMTRSIRDHLPSAYNLLFRDDGQLIAHPELEWEGATVSYHILGEGTGQPGDGVPPRFGSEAQRAHLRSLFERVKQRQPGEVILELAEHGEYLAVARLAGPSWNFVTVLPKGVVSSAAFQAARYVLLFGVVSLLLELAIMYWVLERQISRPLQAFTQATDRVAAGDFQVELETSRGDELGKLAHAFQLMAGEVQRREEALRQANEGLERRVEERTRELKEVHGRLVETARQAGMAEIATNVLHNVGNVLNSVHTSAQVAKERLAGLKLESVGRVASMLEERQGDLAAFITQDERGRNVTPFLSRLGQNLVEERREIFSLLEDVGRYTEHIGTIVKLQQDYAKVPRMDEQVRLPELVEDALRINAAALGRHEVKVERHLASLPPVMTDRHKVLMILTNLISNAKYAMAGVLAEQRLLSVRLEPPVDGRIRIAIRDNGVGIAPEMLTRIFQHGFTMREEGHGFGLHSSALAAQQLGGSLTAHSDGLGHGATFTLELPYQPVEEAK